MKYKKGTFINIPNKGAIKGQKSFTQSVYLWICEHADDEGLCYPSITTLSKEAGVSRRQVMREITNLENLGILQKEIRAINNKKTTNLYQIMILDEPPVVVPASHHPSASQSPPVVPASHIELNPGELTPVNDPAASAADGGKTNRILTDAERVIEVFYRTVNPTISWGDGRNRRAAQKLIDSIGLQPALTAAEFACASQGDRYCPTITTPYQLMDKLASLRKYYLTKNQSKKKGKIWVPSQPN